MAAESSPRRWLVVTVQGPSAAALEAAAEGLFSLGALAIEEIESGLRTWLPAADLRPAELQERLNAHLALGGADPATVRFELRADADWAAAWRRGLGPRRIGERLVVAPTWSAPERNADDVIVFIDPQMAFGTGEHASTRGVLRLLQRFLRPGDDVLDVGTGSAVLAIAAARLGARHAVGVESDADALVNAVENVARNGVADRVTLEHTLVDAAFLEARGCAIDLIVANVLSSVLLPLLPAFRQALRPGGRLILGGILQAEAASMCAAAATAGLTVQEEDREEEWWSACFAAQ